MLPELFKIVVTQCATLLVGIFLLVASQFLIRFIIDPYLDLKRLLGKVGHTLMLYSHYLHNASVMASKSEFQRATGDCRKLASRLWSYSNAVPFYDKLAWLRLVPEHCYVREAARELIGLSNANATTAAPEVQHHYERISKLLDIRLD